MSVKNQNYFRGFLVPTTPFNKDSFDSVLTTASQVGPRAGNPENLTSNSLSISAYGDQNDISDMIVETTKGGTPGDVNNSPLFKFYETGTTNYYGQFGRSGISGFEMIAAQSATQNYNFPNVLYLANGDKLVTYQRYQVGQNKFVMVDFCAAIDSTSNWTNKLTIEIPNSIGGTGFDVHPCLVQMDNNEILLAFFELQTYWNITLYRSIDNGENWTRSNDNALPLGIQPTNQIQQRIRLSYSRGQLILIVEYYYGFALETHRNRIQQYLSINKGMTFSLVDQSIAGDGYFFKTDLYTDTNGDFIFTWIRSPDFISILRFSDGGSSIVDQVAGNDFENVVDYSSGGITDTVAFESLNLLSTGECTSYETNSGERHVIYTNRALIGGVIYFSSILKYGINSSLNSFLSSQIIINQNDDTTRLRDTHARYCDARSGLFSSHNATPGPDDNSVHVIWLNSQSNTSLLQGVSFPAITNNQQQVVSFYATYFPFDLPQDTGFWTQTTTGTSTNAILDGKLRIVSTTATSSVYYTDVNLDATSTIRCSLRSLVGGSTTSLTRGIELIYDSGTNRYVVEIRIDTTALSIYDVIGATEVGNTTYSGFANIQLLISFTGPQLIVHFNDQIYKSRKQWTKIVDAGITSGGSTGVINQIKWGHVNNVGALTDTYFYEFLVGTSASKYDVVPNLIGVKYPATGYKQFVNGGLSISTSDGPARIGDQYRIEKQYDYALERTCFDVNTSPRIKWRSANTNNQDIVFYTFGQNQIDDLATNNIGAITLLGCNFQSFELFYFYGGIWKTLGSFDLSTNLICNLIRVGNVVRSTTSGGGSFYAFENEFAGCFCVLNNGVTNAYRKILSNSSGVMGQTNGKPAAFVLDGIDNTEPTTGIFKIYAKDITITHSIEVSAKWKIAFSTQLNVDGYFQIGQIIHGSLFIFAPQYGRGRSITYEANTEIYETQDNQIRTKVISVGNRKAKLSWTDPIDQTELYTSTFDGDFFNTSNANTQTHAIANYGDIPYSMIGLYQYLEGAGKPIVYLPAIQAGSTTPILLNRYHDFIYGITTSPIIIDNVLGDENVNEIFRVSQIEIREIT